MTSSVVVAGHVMAMSLLPRLPMVWRRLLWLAGSAAGDLTG
jgi:hypothetical protein